MLTDSSLHFSWTKNELSGTIKVIFSASLSCSKNHYLSLGRVGVQQVAPVAFIRNRNLRASASASWYQFSCQRKQNAVSYLVEQFFTHIEKRPSSISFSSVCQFSMAKWSLPEANIGQLAYTNPSCCTAEGPHPLPKGTSSFQSGVGQVSYYIYRHYITHNA